MWIEWGRPVSFFTVLYVWMLQRWAVLYERGGWGGERERDGGRDREGERKRANDKQTDRQIDRRTDRQTVRQTDRQAQTDPLPLQEEPYQPFFEGNAVMSVCWCGVRVQARHTYVSHTHMCHAHIRQSCDACRICVTLTYISHTHIHEKRDVLASLRHIPCQIMYEWVVSHTYVRHVTYEGVFVWVSVDSGMDEVRHICQWLALNSDMSHV